MLKETAVPAISEALPVVSNIDHITAVIPVAIPAPSDAEPKIDMTLFIPPPLPTFGDGLPPLLRQLRILVPHRRLQL